jgi:hypothetical protein
MPSSKSQSLLHGYPLWCCDAGIYEVHVPAFSDSNVPRDFHVFPGDAQARGLSVSAELVLNRIVANCENLTEPDAFPNDLRAHIDSKYRGCVPAYAILELLEQS